MPHKTPNQWARNATPPIRRTWRHSGVVTRTHASAPRLTANALFKGRGTQGRTVGAPDMPPARPHGIEPRVLSLLDHSSKVFWCRCRHKGQHARSRELIWPSQYQSFGGGLRVGTPKPASAHAGLKSGAGESIQLLSPSERSTFDQHRPNPPNPSPKGNRISKLFPVASSPQQSRAWRGGGNDRKSSKLSQGAHATR